MQPYFDAERNAQEAYGRAHDKLEALAGGRRLEAPSQPAVAAAREMADALDRWLLAKGAAEKAHRWVEAKEREVKDLEFQVTALRAQLEEQMGGNNQAPPLDRDAYLATCNQLSPEAQRCSIMSYAMEHQEECAAVQDEINGAGE